MKFTLKVKTSDASIQKKILEEMRSQIRSKMGTIQLPLQEAIKDYISLSIKNSNFYNNFMTGKLKTQLGVVDTSLSMSQIIDALKSTVVITVGQIAIYGGSQIKCIITIQAVPDDFQAALSVPMAQYLTDKGEIIPWLSWVLFEGSSPVVLDYEMVFGKSEFSRTQDAIMRTKPGQKWRIPSEFRGTAHTNFIYRALNDNIPELEKILDDLLSGVFK